MLSGVSKSGSPTASEMMSRPSALRSRAFCVTAMVAEGFTRERASAMKAMKFQIPSCARGNEGDAPPVASVRAAWVASSVNEHRNGTPDLHRIGGLTHF